MASIPPLSLGYSSWGEYFEAGFGQKRTRGYQLIDASRVAKAIEAQSTNVDSLPNEAQARELAPLAKSSQRSAAASGSDFARGQSSRALPSVWRSAVAEWSPITCSQNGECSSIARTTRPAGLLSSEQPPPEPLRALGLFPRCLGTGGLLRSRLRGFSRL